MPDVKYLQMSNLEISILQNGKVFANEIFISILNFINIPEKKRKIGNIFGNPYG